MFTPLLQYLTEQSQTAISADDVKLLQQAFVFKKFKKKQFLLQQGEICRHIAFILKGAVRQYTVDEKGNERVMQLAIENWWAADRESFHKLTPSIYNIVAWEETDVLMLPKADGWYDKVNTIPAFCEMRIRLDDAHHMAMQRRLHATINYSAEHRYEELKRNYPAFLNRFPQHIIASYLGVTKETLSRIRNHTAKQ